MRDAKSWVCTKHSFVYVLYFNKGTISISITASWFRRLDGRPLWHSTRRKDRSLSLLVLCCSLMSLRYPWNVEWPWKMHQLRRLERRWLLHCIQFIHGQCWAGLHSACWQEWGLMSWRRSLLVHLHSLPRVSWWNLALSQSSLSLIIPPSLSFLPSFLQTLLKTLCLVLFFSQACLDQSWHRGPFSLEVTSSPKYCLTVYFWGGFIFSQRHPSATVFLWLRGASEGIGE